MASDKQKVNLNVGIEPNHCCRTVHTIVHEIREKISEKIPRCDIMVSTFPVEVAGGIVLSHKEQ